MANFVNCIVSYIDMMDIGSLLSSRSRDAVHKMRQMHKAVSHPRLQISAHKEVCLWNDSVLMVGFVTESRSCYRALMREVCVVKQVIDSIQKSYAICVKGKAFPGPQMGTEKRCSVIGQPRLVYLQASSLAFANCFEIEHQAKEQGWKWDWYIDNRIRTKLSLRPGDESKEVELYPGGRVRRVHMYKGSFWDVEKAYELEHIRACA